MNSNKGILYSLIAHATFVLIMVLQVVFYPNEALDLSRALRVDMVDLPDKVETYQMPEEIANPPQPAEPEKKEAEPIVEEKTKPVEPAPPKPEPPKEPVVALKPEPKKPEKPKKPEPEKKDINKIKTKQKDALNKLKAAAAIDKLKKEMTDNKPSDKPKTVFKGRALSAGTSLTGLDKLQSDSYLAQLDAKIKAHWSLPQWLIGKPLRTRVQIKFDENGSVIFKKIVQSSGNSTYDDYCLSAIEKSTPFPAVPEKFTVVYKVDGVIIGFPD